MLITQPNKEVWLKSYRRVLLNGAPLRGKTTSLKTFPKPIHIIVAPGEMGYSSLFPDPPHLNLYYWEFDTASPIIAWAKVWVEFKILCTDILNGKYGSVETLAIDGLHKLYYVIQKAHGYTQDSEAREYSRYHEVFTNQMSVILGSSIPYVVATVYDGPEATEPGSKVTQVFPQLPGRMAKDIMGLFPCVFHAELRVDEKGSIYSWRLQPSVKMQAAGFHLPKEITSTFPAELPQDWAIVEKLITGCISKF